MEEGKKRKRESVLLSITIVLVSAALIVQVLFGKEGLLRKNSESIRDVLIEEAAKNRGADSIYVEGDTAWLYKNKVFIGTAVFETVE